MIAQVFADAGRVALERDAVARQEGGAADAGELQQLRRLHAAGAQDGFTRRARTVHQPTVSVFDTGGTCAFKQDAGHHCAGDKLQLGPLHRRVKIAFAHTEAKTAAGGKLHQSAAEIVPTVVVRIFGEAGLGAGTQKCVGERIAWPVFGDCKRSVAPAHGRIAAGIGFHAAKQRRHIVVAPTRVAQIAPMVVFGRIAAHPEHAIDGSGAAGDATARPEQRPPAQARLGFGVEAPQRALTDHHLGDPGRYFEPDPLIVVTGLDQQHAVAARFGEPIGQSAAGRAGADNDEIENLSRIRHLRGTIVGPADAHSLVAYRPLRRGRERRMVTRRHNAFRTAFDRATPPPP